MLQMSGGTVQNICDRDLWTPALNGNSVRRSWAFPPTSALVTLHDAFTVASVHITGVNNTVHYCDRVKRWIALLESVGWGNVEKLYVFVYVYMSVCMYVCNYVCMYKKLRWSRGSVLAFNIQVRGFKPGRSRRIFRAKKSSARLPSEGK